MIKPSRLMIRTVFLATLLTLGSGLVPQRSDAQSPGSGRTWRKIDCSTSCSGDSCMCWQSEE